MALPDPDEVPLLTPAMVVASGVIPGLRRSALYAAMKRRDIPCVRVGGRVFVPNARLRERLEIQ